MDLDRLIDFYQKLSPDNVGRLPEFYRADAYFKDPFNEVRGVAAIQAIFAHMFEQVDAPRFVVTERLVEGQASMLGWEFHFRPRGWGRGQTQCIRGVSHLKSGADGKIHYHRDYWDAAEELYMKLPLLGGVLRCLRARLGTKLERHGP